MASISVSKSKIERDGGVVILSVAEYRRLCERAVPEYYLTGKAAEEADRLVEEGLREYKEGKTKKLRSLADLD